MRGALRLAAFGALFLYGLVPWEAKAAVVSFVVGAPAALSAPGRSGDLSRPGFKPRRRPARLARDEDASLSVLSVAEPPAVPLPVPPRFISRFLAPRPSARDGHRPFLGRDRAPPA